MSGFLAIAALLAGCRPSVDSSRGVELVLSSTSPSPAMTFELRFDQAVAPAGKLGSEVANPPLVISPPIPGKFVWLSPRSGVYTPSEPLAMDTRYQLTLRAGLMAADGRPVEAWLRKELRTPAFQLGGFSPRSASTNASSEPEVRLVFNAEVEAREAERFMEFADDQGQRVAAETRQGIELERLWSYELGANGSPMTWEENFSETRPDRPRRHAHRAWSEGDSTNEVGNLLVVTPRQPLPLGPGWRLVVGSGLPATDPRLRMHERREVPIGQVTPFHFTGLAVHHVINLGPSIGLEFSKRPAELLTNRFGEWIEVDPVPEKLGASVEGRELVLRGEFKSQVAYHLKLRLGLPAEEPFKLAETVEREVTIPPVEPRLYFPAFSTDQMASGNRSFPLLLVNTPQVRVRAKLIEPQNAIHALRGYAGYYRPWRDLERRRTWEEPYQGLDYKLVPGRTVCNEEMPGTRETDIPTTLDLRWDHLLRGRKAGVVLLEAEREAGDQLPRLGTQALIQLTDLGLIWKAGRDGFDVFVFSQSNGKPVAGATSWLLSDENEVLREALTDASGLARLGTHTNAAWVAVRLGDDFHALELEKHQIYLGQFGIPAVGEEAPVDSRRVLLFSDRDFYRPGETVYLKAIARDWTDTGWSIPAGVSGWVTVADARGRQIVRTNLVFSPTGAWSLPVVLPTAGPRGTCLMELKLGERSFTHSFQIQDFQPSAFEITLEAKPAFMAGEKIQLPLSARYYFGKRLSRAQVKWTMDTAERAFRPARFGGFSFEANDLERPYGRGSSVASVTGEGMLSGATNLVIAADLPVNSVRPQPRLVSVFAEVTDLNQQTLSQQVEFTRHSSDFYIGLRAGAAVLALGAGADERPALLRRRLPGGGAFTVGQELPVQVVVVGADERPWSQPVTARLRLRRVEWENVLVRGAGRTARYRNQRVVTNLLEKEIELQPVALPAKADEEAVGQSIGGLVPTQAGLYLVELQAKDSGGRAVVSSLSLSVSAPAEVGWDYRNDVQIPLKPSQAVYAPGQTAEVLVETPISGMALVTVERETVRQSFLTRLEGNAPMIRIPITAGDVPNVFVSVTIVRGAADCPRQIKEPEYRVGYCQLTVQEPRNRLAVTITPAATNCLPAQMVEVGVEVRDARGEAVRDAEVTLYAVDEGILSLSAHAEPDPYAFFYEARPLAVHASISLPNLFTEDPDEFEFHNKGYLGGGGGQEAVRKNFLACAFWNATLNTAADGRVTARFTAPDSLTRYRLMAVAHAGAGAFGAARSAFQVAKPLLVEPALARFANVGDRQVARAVVHNQTAQAGEVLVSLTLDDQARPAEGQGSNAPAGLSRRVMVPANGSAVVEFSLEFIQAGMAKWVWKARFADPTAGAFTDAVQSTIEVGYPAPWLREILLTRTLDLETNLLARANPQLLAGEGTMTVQVANTRLVELVETLAYLLHYPYGCVEQASSSLLPWVLLQDLPGLAPLLPYDREYREGAIRSGVARLISMQTQAGGLGYWPGAKEPMLWGSAYGGLVLALAERRGIEVPHDDLGRLMDYLSAQVRAAGTRLAEVGDAPLALYALSVAGRSEPAYHEQLFAQRARLSPEDRALVALAVAESQGPPEMMRELLSTNLPAREYDDRRFDCSARERAIRLLAWTRFKADSPQVGGLARDLMNEQEQAHWGTTQGDAWALLALTDYARRVEGAPQAAAGRLVWGDRVIPFDLDAGTNLVTTHLPFARLADARLLLMNPSGKRLYTSLTLEARPPLARQPRQDHGFSLTRLYQRLDDEGHPQSLAGLRVGDRVLVTLRLSAREPARYVAIDDALPSLLEAVNPEFIGQTSRAQPGQEGGDWVADFRELRKDRFLSFADWVAPGNYELRYLARVCAAGTVAAPSAKAEAMYHPSRYGLTESETLSSQPME